MSQKMIRIGETLPLNARVKLFREGYGLGFGEIIGLYWLNQ